MSTPAPTGASETSRAEPPQLPEPQPWWRRLIRPITVLIVMALVAMPFLATDLQLRRFSQVLVLVLAVLGVNLATGYAGLISLGHGVFVGVGAFAMANYLDDLSLPMPLALLLATATAGVFGVILGLPALRVKGVYLALVTLGFAIAFGPIARRLGTITGEVTGRAVEFDTDPPDWTGLGVERTQLYNYLVCLLVVGLWFVAVHNLTGSRVGRALRAVRDDELAAAAFGVNLTRAKTGAFGLSAAMAGTAGALQAFLFPFVSHTNFGVFLSLRLYAAAVLGGLGTLIGAVYGVLALLLVPLFNRFLGFLGSDAAVFGLGLIVLTYLAPRGIAGLVERIDSRALVERLRR